MVDWSLKVSWYGYISCLNFLLLISLYLLYLLYIHRFLDTEIDLDFVSHALAAIHISRKELMGLSESLMPSRDPAPVTNEVVMDLEHFRIKEGLPKSFVCSWILKLTGSANIPDAKLHKDITKMMTDFHKLKTRKCENKDSKIQAFCASEFVCQHPKPTTTSTTTTSTSSTERKQEQSIKQLQTTIKNMTTEMDTLKSTVDDLSRDKMELLDKKKELETKVENLENEIGQCQCESKERRQLMKENIHMKHQVQSTKNTERSLKRLKLQLSDHERERNTTVESCERKLRKLNEKVKTLENENVKLLNEIDKLNIELLEKKNVELRIKEEGNRYNDNVRKTVLSLKEANIPSRRCSEVIKIVASNLFEHEFDKQDLPSHQTVLNICDEGHVLARVQVADQMLASDNVTLHTDGTSRDQKKYVSQQISLDSGDTLTLGFKTVACENSKTLLEVASSQLDELATLYAEYKEKDRDEIFKEILVKITSLMSDRASVMKKFNEEFLSFIKSEVGQEHHIHFLYCNAHFLLGLSRSCIEELKITEKDLGRKLGRDQLPRFRMFSSTTENATSRLIRTASDLVGPRGDSKNGCREDWLAFCEEEDKVSFMTSYRSNR